MATKEKLIEAAIEVFLERSFAGSSVEEICKRAGTTKGAFFHHFQSKEEVGLLALNRFSEMMTGAFQEGIRGPDEPVGRVFDYLDRVIAVGGAMDAPACLVALLTLQLGAAHPTFREAADRAFGEWLDSLESMFADALQQAGRPVKQTPRQLAEYVLATLEGSLIIFRARGDKEVVRRNLTQFSEHFRMLLTH